MINNGLCYMCYHKALLYPAIDGKKYVGVCFNCRELLSNGTSHIGDDNELILSEGSNIPVGIF